jgi:hypothetical protein
MDKIPACTLTAWSERHHVDLDVDRIVGLDDPHLQVVDAYLAITRHNDAEQAVVEAIDGDDAPDIVYELLDTAQELDAVRGGIYDEDLWADAFDQFRELLPTVREALA